MKVLLFGATGMIGQGVLRECLLDPDVTQVRSVGRSPSGEQHPKLDELITTDLFDLSTVELQLAGYDACFFCLGASSTGMNEAEYRRLTFDLTVSVGQLLARLNPDSTFVYVSGAGTDSTEAGRTMWARVKGATENALLAMPLRAYMFRPGYIQPMHGATSRTRSYRVMYAVVSPLYPVLRRAFPKGLTTTERMGQAMLAVAKHGAPSHVLSAPEINAVAAAH
jgi:uncharacterized protein YbjT (DUF2867 family)